MVVGSPTPGDEEPGKYGTMTVASSKLLTRYLPKVLEGKVPSRPPLVIVGNTTSGRGLPERLLDDDLEVNFYERDGRGGWRWCRQDKWSRWDSQDHWPQAQQAAAAEVTRSLLAGYPSRQDLFAGMVMRSGYLFTHGPDGLFSGRYQYFFGAPVDAPLKLETCMRFDAQGHTILYVEAKASKSCPTGEPSKDDSWQAFRWGPGPEQRPEIKLRVQHTVSDKLPGGWGEEVNVQNSDSHKNRSAGVGTGSDEAGIQKIWGSNMGQKDDNPVNLMYRRDGAVAVREYHFLDADRVPFSAMDNQELIYQFDRRRESWLDESGVTIVAEFFKANEHRPRHRYYLVNKFVKRQEQFDETGRIKRVITVDRWTSPNPQPNPDLDESKLKEDVSWRLLLHRVYHRVYDIDASGKAKLVAASWGERTKFTDLGRASLYSIGVSSHIVFGTPDGQEVWKTEEAFEQAFDFSSSADEVFPDHAAYWANRRRKADVTRNKGLASDKAFTATLAKTGDARLASQAAAAAAAAVVDDTQVIPPKRPPMAPYKVFTP
jgi:hypothetical protein